MDSCTNDSEESMVVGINKLSDLKGITKAHGNCRSLYPKIDEVKVMLKFSKLEMLFISETWLTDAINDSLVDIPGYNTFRMDRDTSLGKFRGGGLIAYIKADIRAQMLPEYSKCTPCV